MFSRKLMRTSNLDVQGGNQLVMALRKPKCHASSCNGKISLFLAPRVDHINYTSNHEFVDVKFEYRFLFWVGGNGKLGFFLNLGCSQKSF